MLVQKCPEIVAEQVIGEFEISLNDWGEFKIHNKYSEETWVFGPEDAEKLRLFMEKGR